MRGRGAAGLGVGSGRSCAGIAAVTEPCGLNRRWGNGGAGEGASLCRAGAGLRH